MTASPSASQASILPVIRPVLGEDEISAVAEALRSGWIAQGPRVARFEAAFADRVGAAHAVATSNCTTALHLALVAIGVGPGDEVVVPSFSFIATTNCVLYTGASPVFADVDPVSGNVSAETVAAVLTPRTRAVIVVHQAGVPADLDALHALCDGAGVELMEDAACAVGSTYRGAPIGAHSGLVAFSFHPRKLLTTGEGGMLTVAGSERAMRLRRLREHGMSISAADRHEQGTPSFESYDETGFNYRMTDLQAAVGLVQLGRVDAIVQRRRSLAAGYHERLAGVDGVRAVADPPYGTTNFQSFWLLLDEEFPISRDELMARCSDAGVSTRRGIMAAHLEPAASRFTTAPLPNTELLCSRSIILPVFHEMTDSDLDRVVEIIAGAAR